MKHPIPNGLLVALEGIDGAGKTSLSALLGQWCGERGLACLLSKEPTGLHWGQELRRSAKAGRLTLEQELELFAKDRADHIGRSIQPMLDAHGIVILDRYFWSTAAYQGARGADVGGILAHHATFAPEPDLWLVVDLEVEEGLRRIWARGDEPNAFEDPSALGRARQIFLDLAMPCAHAMKIDSAGHFRAAFRQTLEAFQAAAVRKIQAGGGPVLDRLVDFYGEIQAVPEALRTSCDPTLPPAR